MRCDDSMSEIDAAADRSALVPGTHRLIRTVDRAEGPFSGALVSHDDGVAVCVDTAELSGWGGWAFSDADHVCGVIDVLRRADGHDALVPWCPQRVETFLGRRQAADLPLAPGELGTLVASLLRGARELDAGSASAVGDWWLTGDGRPLFVHGEGGEARARTAALVERVIEHTGDRATVRVLEEIVAALRERRHHADDDVRWEEHLFTVAAPRALRIDVFAPERAADLGSRRVAQSMPETRRSSRRRERSTLGRERLDVLRSDLTERWHALLSHVSPPGRGESEADSKTEARLPTKGRRRPLIFAGSLAAVVLIVGLMWPEGAETEPANAAQSPPESSRNVAAVPESAQETAPVEEPSPPVVDGADALAAVPALLDGLASCTEAGAETCPEVLVDGAEAPADGLIAQGPDASSASLVDDYGDVAVVKLVPVDENDADAEKMLVLERHEQKWLVRDIYDVAHQPD